MEDITLRYRIWLRGGLTADLTGRKAEKGLTGELHALLAEIQLDGSLRMVPDSPYPAIVAPRGGAGGVPTPESTPSTLMDSVSALQPFLSCHEGIWSRMIAIEPLWRLDWPPEAPWVLQTYWNPTGRAISARLSGLYSGIHVGEQQMAIRYGRQILGETVASIASRYGMHRSQWSAAEAWDRPSGGKRVEASQHPAHMRSEYSDIPPAEKAGFRRPRSKQRRLPVEKLQWLQEELRQRVLPVPEGLIRRLKDLETLHDDRVLRHRFRPTKQDLEAL